MRGCAWALVLAGCGTATGPTDLASSDLLAIDLHLTEADRDGDGLDDADELALATRFLPYLSIAPLDGCKTSGLVFRVTPADGGRVRIRYAWLFDRSCDAVVSEGGGGAISMLVDPADETIVSLRAIARPGTSCQAVSTCGVCLGQTPCATLGTPARPAVWLSQDRHGLFVNRTLRCTQTGACAATCADAPTPGAPPMINAGEPFAPLTRDLTRDGFVRSDNGWQSPSLMHHDPWGGLPFGNGPSVSSLLVGQNTDTPACGP